MNDKELTEFVKRKQAEFKANHYTAEDNEFSGLTEENILDYDGRREVADHTGDRQQFLIDRIKPTNSAEASYKAMLQRQHDYKQRGQALQKQLAVDNYSSKGDRKK